MYSMVKNNTIIEAPDNCDFITSCKDNYVFVVGSPICYVWAKNSSSYICYSAQYGLESSGFLLYNRTECELFPFGVAYPGSISSLTPHMCKMEQ